MSKKNIFWFMNACILLASIACFTQNAAPTALFIGLAIMLKLDFIHSDAK